MTDLYTLRRRDRHIGRRTAAHCQKEKQAHCYKIVQKIFFKDREAHCKKAGIHTVLKKDKHAYIAQSTVQ